MKKILNQITKISLPIWILIGLIVNSFLLLAAYYYGVYQNFPEGLSYFGFILIFSFLIMSMVGNLIALINFIVNRDSPINLIVLQLILMVVIFFFLLVQHFYVFTVLIVFLTLSFVQLIILIFKQRTQTQKVISTFMIIVLVLTIIYSSSYVMNTRGPHPVRKCQFARGITCLDFRILDTGQSGLYLYNYIGEDIELINVSFTSDSSLCDLSNNTIGINLKNGSKTVVYLGDRKGCNSKLKTFDRVKGDLNLGYKKIETGLYYTLKGVLLTYVESLEDEVILNDNHQTDPIIQPKQFLPNKCQFSNQIICLDHQILNGGQSRLRLANKLGNDIEITHLSFIDQNGSCNLESSIEKTVLLVGRESIFNIGGADGCAGGAEADRRILGDLVLEYRDLQNGFTKTIPGTLMTRVI